MTRIIGWATAVACRVQTRLLVRDEKGASLVEYALLLALIAVAAVGALMALGGTVQHAITNVNDGFTTSSTVAH